MESVEEMKAHYCPECKTVFLHVKEMPEMQIMSKPGNPKASKIIYKGVELKRCPIHEGKLGIIGSMDNIKNYVYAQQQACELVLDKFSGVRNLVLGGGIKNPMEFLDSIKTFFFAKSELEALEW